jgi:hypothetical protein
MNSKLSTPTPPLKLGPTVRKITAERAMVEGTMIVLVTPVLGVITRSTSVNVVIRVMPDSISVLLATTTNPSVFVPVKTSVRLPLLQRKDGADGRLQQAREKVFL